MENTSLAQLGWNTFFEKQLTPAAESFLIGRVAIENKTNYTVLTPGGSYVAEATGKLFYMAENDAELPKVGDWVLMTETDRGKSMIHQVLDRRTVISRKVAGKKAEEQIIAANVDKLLIVQGLDSNFNMARLERYLTLAAHVEPVIVLNKADLCDDPQAVLDKVRQRIKGVSVVVASALSDQIELLHPHIEAGTTVAVVGSSGVGKSTLINKLIGQEVLATGEVRWQDDKGKHTTTTRHLIVLPHGGILIDTPGMRELQLWGDDSSLAATFADIEVLAKECKFSDCSHTGEKGCAIEQALQNGSLDEAHWVNYSKMKKELEYLESKQDVNAMLEKKKKWKKIHKEVRRINKDRNK